ncbi:MAG: glycosyltransferase [Methylocystis sp.]|nr:glycosyltransferase [Methylocystis sp.]
MAYKALGARAISIAMMDAPGLPPLHGGRWRSYAEATASLPADRRFFTGPSFAHILTPSFLSDAWWRLIHGNQAAFLVELAARARLPEGLETETIDLVHANHYFTLPFVAKLIEKRAAPVILETQDIQARQYMLRNQGGFFLPPHATYDDMLAIELAWMQKADLSAHLNEEERQTFSQLLPNARHALVYPAVAPVPAGPGGNKIVLVASDNYGNYMSVRWFLEEVMPQARGVPVEIFGNIDGGVKRRDKNVFEGNRRYFKGRVEDIGAVYADAACVLLPTIEGHGLSIKAVEALSSGAPLIATPQAFRGMKIDPRQLANVTLAEDAASFAAALREVHRLGFSSSEGASRAASDTRRFYDDTFSFAAYTRALHDVAAPLVGA